MAESNQALEPDPHRSARLVQEVGQLRELLVALAELGRVFGWTKGVRVGRHGRSVGAAWVPGLRIHRRIVGTNRNCLELGSVRPPGACSTFGPGLTPDASEDPCDVTA